MMKKKHLMLPLLLMLCLLGSGCSNSEKPLHHGLIPFRWLEAAPSRGQAAFYEVLTHRPGSTTAKLALQSVREGDVIAFHMSHSEARAYLKRVKLQKLPYEFFRYGHLALSVKLKEGGELRLLQTAMGERASAEHGQEYLMDKSWTLYRLCAGIVNLQKLTEFTQAVTQAAPGYDMVATFGLINRGLRPTSVHDLSSRYTCATLVVAALHHAGYPLRVTRCGGALDLITPGQVVRARVETR
jgi:hypothetical protein